MSFAEAIRTVWSKYATLSGRAARPEYWWWVLFVVLLNIATSIVDGVVIAPGELVQPLSSIAALVLSGCRFESCRDRHNRSIQQ